MTAFFPADPTYGYDLARLREVPAPPGPPDFEAFWRETYAEALAVPADVATREIASPHPGHRLFEVEYTALGGVRIGGWISVPKSDGGHGGWIVGHGYGGRDGVGFDLPPPAGPALYFCSRGFNRSRHAFLPGAAPEHVVYGIEHRETYIHRGCVADIWSAATALIELFPAAAENLRYAGASFGGGLGALALPWDPRFHRAFLDIPSFGNHPLRVQMPCTGSGEAVRVLYQSRPEILEVLAYFDAATAATHGTTPTLIAPALYDPAVPPPGQFAIANAIPAEKEVFIRASAHLPTPPTAAESRELNGRLARWFAS